MKLLDPLGGLLTTCGSSIVHFLYLITYGVVYFTNKDITDQ